MAIRQAGLLSKTNDHQLDRHGLQVRDRSRPAAVRSLQAPWLDGTGGPIRNA